MHNFFEHFKAWLDALSFATVLATLSAWLPPMAALVSIIWGLIRIYETDTMQRLLSRRKERVARSKRTRVIADRGWWK